METIYDYEPAMDFVTACANIRYHIFDIANKSHFEVKSMAGNIIPAKLVRFECSQVCPKLVTFRTVQKFKLVNFKIFTSLGPNL